MPSSVAHSFAGIFIHQLWSRNKPRQSALHKDWKALLPFLLLPNVADIDWFISYLVFNDPKVLHSGITHTLGFVLIGALLLAPLKIFGSPQTTFALSLALLGSHLVLDMATGKTLGGSDSYGVMLFYPFSSARMGFPITLFLGIRHRTFDDLFSRTNVARVLWEFLVLTPLIYFTGKLSTAFTGRNVSGVVADGKRL